MVKPVCNFKLYIRSDIFSLAVLYDHKLGTLPALHYTRYCRKSGCSFQQHYGYYTRGSLDDVIYNDDAHTMHFCFGDSRMIPILCGLLGSFFGTLISSLVSFASESNAPSCIIFKFSMIDHLTIEGLYTKISYYFPIMGTSVLLQSKSYELQQALLLTAITYRSYLLHYNVYAKF